MCSKILSSTFSINMLAEEDCTTVFRTLSKEEFLEEIKTIDSNVVNPHESTAAIVATVTDLPCAGGFASVKAGDQVLVIMPPRSLMSRSGAEVNVSDLDSCQFKLVKVINLKKELSKINSEALYELNGASLWSISDLFRLIK